MLSQRLQGLRVELLDSESVEVFLFNGDRVSATLGVKDGAVVAPILRYEVTSEKSLIIRGLFTIIWEDIEFIGDSISVRRNGVNTVYDIVQKIEPKNRYLSW